MIKVWVEIELPGSKEEFDEHPELWHTTGDPEVIQVIPAILENQSDLLDPNGDRGEDTFLFKFLRVVEDDD